MAPTKVLNCSHGQALSFEHSQYEQLAKGRALRQFTPSGSLKKSSFLKKNFVLYPTKILFLLHGGQLRSWSVEQEKEIKNGNSILRVFVLTQPMFPHKRFDRFLP